MALYNLRRVSTATTGTGDITLGSAVSGFRSFSDSPAVPTNSYVTYAIADGGNSEIGCGFFNGTTLTRNVSESTNSNTAISLSGSAQVFITPSAGDLQSPTAFPSRFRNGTMDIWQRGTSAITATTAGAYTADGWIVTPSGGSVTVAAASSRALTVNSLQITGGSNVTDVILKQRIESYIAAPMSSQQVTFQAWVYNNTGGSVTPTLTVKHPTAADNYTSSFSDVSAVTLQSCANGAWTQIAYTFTASSSSYYGMEVIVDFGNNFSSNGKTLSVTECDLRVTPGIPSGINYAPPVPMFRPIHEELIFCERYFQTSYELNVAPGSITIVGAFVRTVDATSSYPSIQCPFRTAMRASPTTITTYSPNSGASSKIYVYSSADVAATVSFQGSKGFTAYVNNSSVPISSTITVHWAATAEL